LELGGKEKEKWIVGNREMGNRKWENGKMGNRNWESLSKILSIKSQSPKTQIPEHGNRNWQY
jgi:hypothetical protein